MTEKKMVAERYSAVGDISFSRSPRVCYCGNTLWTVVQKEENDTACIVVYANDGTRTQLKEISCSGHPYDPKITSSGTKVLLAWIEMFDGAWRIMYCEIDAKTFDIGEAEKVHSSSMLLDTPAIAAYNNVPYVAWSERTIENFQICVACKKHGLWTAPNAVSEKGVDAFRPDITASEPGVFVVFDRYKDHNYEVCFGELKDLCYKELKVFSDQGSRQLTARIISSTNAVYMAWVVLNEVEDDRGIRDHAPFIYCAMYKNGEIRMLTDPDNSENINITADLREGLLARYLYCGFYGLRRNPLLSLDSNGQLWCFWEVMFEDDYEPKNGHLIGRKLSAQGHWEPPIEILCGCYAYAIPGHFDKNTIPVACINPKKEALNIIQSSFVAPDLNKAYSTDPNLWRKWQPAAIAPPKKNRKKINAAGREYCMYWADTHCHSVLSPDAEGEADELVHFARDIAGLDALCILDNDYYPYKALTVPEWKKHQELAQHFTKDGDFVLFPGFEFTAKKSKHTNHRTIFYPRGGGELFRCHDAKCSTDEKLFSALKKTDAIVSVHHVTYEIIDKAVDKNVEIAASWRVCMAECDFTMKQLLAGRKFGFMGSSDAHRANPGLGCAWTGVYAEELTPESLAEAYNARRLVATQGFPIHIDFRAGNGFIGQEVEASSSDVKFYMKVEAPKKIERLRLIRDGKYIHEYAPDGTNFELESDDRPGKGEHFYFLEVKLEGNPGYNVAPEKNSYEVFSIKGNYPHNLCPAQGVFAWTSPIWVKI